VLSGIVSGFVRHLKGVVMTIFSRTMLVTLSVYLSLPAAGAARSATSSPAGLPPLIDRELFFGNPEIAGAQISPDGRYIAFLKPWKDTRNIWVKKTGEPFASARRVTNEAKRPIPAFAWSRDSAYILFVQDHGGDENYNVYAVNPAEAPAAGADVPSARNITDAKGARALIYSVPRNQPDTLYIGLNDRDPAWHDLYRLSISTGKRELLRKNTERVSSWVFDNAGALRLAVRTTDAGDTELLRVDEQAMTPVYTCSVLEACGPVHFDKDNAKVYLETSKGEGDLSRLVLFDPATQAETLVESDPLGRVDFGTALFSDKTDALIATVYTDEKDRIYFKDKEYASGYALLQKKLPGKEIEFGSSTADEQRWLVSASSDTEPGETYLFDRGTKALALQYRIREKLPRPSLAGSSPITYPSSDGLRIPAYLTLPKGVPAKSLPLIVFPHGGPWARDQWGFSGIAQFLANRGYAVLQPNFRGSTGYGKKFLNAGNKQWGDLMQDDVTWGVKYLVGQGIADPKRVGIMGGSYGGYATLAGVAFTPDVYAAAVSIVGPSNLVTLLDSIPPYWEAARRIFYVRMGDPRTPEGKQQLERQSPLHSAGRIRTPLLVAQGANDPRVNKAESDQIVIALRDRGFPVEYIVAPDEGHGFQRPVNNLALFAAAEKFLATHLGGRYQAEATPEVAARLAEITVDPASVVLAKKLDPSAIGVPTPQVDLVPSSASYKATIAVGGQTINMDITTKVTEDAGTWLASEVATSPMGEMSDQTTLEKGTLVVKKRSIKQGPVAIDLSFDDDKATGTMNMGGQSRPVSADLGGALFADGAGSNAVLATLPLEVGYRATFRNFNVQTQKVRLRQVLVVGAEDVTVPAGTFKAWKIEESSAEGEPGGSTIWVAQDSRRVVRITATLPQMNGAQLTSELQP
jgi:dipeptidyl aminopeptidase/acylaminoacyl peptidase